MISLADANQAGYTAHDQVTQWDNRHNPIRSGLGRSLTYLDWCVLTCLRLSSVKERRAEVVYTGRPDHERVAVFAAPVFRLKEEP